MHRKFTISTLRPGGYFEIYWNYHYTNQIVRDWWLSYLDMVNPLIRKGFLYWKESYECFQEPVTYAAFADNDDVIKWKHFPRYWPLVRGIRRSLVDSPHNGQWHGVLMFSLIYAWTNGWASNRNTGDFTRHPAHCDIMVMNTKWPELISVWMLSYPPG